jgi:hypothetical protein
MTGSNMNFSGTGVTMDSYKGLFGGTKATPAKPGNDVLDRSGFTQRNNTAAATPGAIDPWTDYLGQKSRIYSDYSYLTGGPNWGLIRQLNQQKKDKTKLYKTNRADVENMYGQLSADVESDTAAVGQSFDTGIQNSANSANQMVSGLSAEMGNQDARRAKAAAELGVSNENVLTDYQSTDRLNEAMGSILGQNQNWQGLLNSQKGTAMTQGNTMKTAVGNEETQMVTAMKQTYDSAISNLNGAITNEKSRQAVRKLTDEGKLLMGISTAKIKKTLMDQAGLSSGQANKYVKAQQELTDFYDITPDAKYGSPSTFNGKDPNTGKQIYSQDANGWHSMMTDQYKLGVENFKLEGGRGLDSFVMKYGQNTGLTPGAVVPDYGGFYGKTSP